MIHVYPINDIEEHNITSCWCVPKIIEENGELIIIHNAFDGRILKENGNTGKEFSDGEIE